MDAEFWAKALAISGSLGFVVSMALRYLPGVKNRLVVPIGYITIVLTNVALLWGEFIRNAGFAVGQLPDDSFGVSMVYAGFFGFLKPLLVVAQPILISAIQMLLNRVTHEGAIKPLVKGT